MDKTTLEEIVFYDSVCCLCMNQRMYSINYILLQVVTILTKERKVEIMPDPTKIVVKVDGEPITLPELPDTVRYVWM